MSSGEDLRVIDKTEAFKFLDIYHKATPSQRLIDTMERIFESDPLEPGTRANQFLFGTVDAERKRIPNGAWDIVSGKFIEKIKGELRVIGSGAALITSLNPCSMQAKKH